MKKIIYCFGAALMAVACTQTPERALIKAEMSGMTADDSVVVMCGENKDTLAAPNGVFTYEYTDSVANMVQFYSLPKKMANGMMEAFRMRPVLVMMSPNNTLTIKGDFDNYQITGNKFYEEYNEAYKSLEKADGERKSAQETYMKMARSQAAENELTAQFAEVKKLDSIYQQQVFAYVADHLDSDAALYLLFLNSSAKGGEYINQFSDRVKNGDLKGIYTKMAEYYEKMAARKKAAELIKEGKPAPDFTLNDLEGKSFTLSSLHDKYVVLDFWGSWCGWCVKGMPDMKEMYKKYKGKLEIVGVDCRDTEEKWKAAVAKHELPWINVINDTDPKKDLSTIYNVPGFPTKVIISPEGKIAKIVVGESPEFYETIEKLMKK